MILDSDKRRVLWYYRRNALPVVLHRRDPRILGMGHLRDRVADIAALIPRSKPVVYLDYPVHTNIGDLLIEKGTESFFAALGYEVVDQRSAYDFCPSAMRRVPEDATIVLHGGGNFGDLYELHQPFREHVIANFPNHRIVLLPQTMHFESTERLKMAAAVFAKHQDLHVCLRDTVSQEAYRCHFVNPAYLVPDMAHFLWDVLAGDDAMPPGRGTLLLARRDKEKHRLLHGADGLQPRDWPDFIRPYETFVFRALRKLHVKHCVLGDSVPLYRAWQVLIERLIGSAVRAVCAHESVVTNRLHAAIFGLLLGRPVTMYDNSYGKLSTYYMTWLADIPGVRLNAEEEGSPEPPRLRASAVQA